MGNMYMGMFQNYRRCSLLATTCLAAPSQKALHRSQSGSHLKPWHDRKHFFHTHESGRFYTEQWITDDEFIPTTPADLMVLRTKFEESVRRHLLAEVSMLMRSHWSLCCFLRFLMASSSLVVLTPPWWLLFVRYLS